MWKTEGSSPTEIIHPEINSTMKIYINYNSPLVTSFPSSQEIIDLMKMKRTLLKELSSKEPTEITLTVNNRQIT